LYYIADPAIHFENEKQATKGGYFCFSAMQSSNELDEKSGIDFAVATSDPAIRVANEKSVLRIFIFSNLRVQASLLAVIKR